MINNDSEEEVFLRDNCDGEIRRNYKICPQLWDGNRLGRYNLACTLCSLWMLSQTDLLVHTHLRHPQEKS